MADVILCPHCLSRVEPGKDRCPFCDKSLRNSNPPGTLPFASLLAGRYTVGRHIFTDGEGVMYAALENSGGVRVILKEYFPVTLSEGRDAAGSILPKEGKEVLFKTTRMDFADLYRSIMRITPATGLAAVLDVVEANNTVYAVLEQVGGETLSHYLSEHPGCIPAAQARSMMQAVMEGVAALHKAGLVHRGISPENILLTGGGTARLCGYGTLGLRTEGGELKSQLYEGYSAPEQYSAAEFEGRYTDVYGLAAVFYRLVTGQAPVSARQRLVSDSLPAARQLEPSVPGHVSAVLEGALELDPAQRIQNVPELMGALMSERAAESLSHPTGREWAVSGKSLLAGSLVVIAVLFALLLWSILGRESGQPVTSTSQPASSETPEAVLVPDFTGYTYSQLQSDPQFSANYRFAITAQEYSSDYAQGVVIRQTPEEGTTTTETQPLIELVISKGPEKVEMPNIIGFTRESAEKELAASNIKASFFMIENNGDYASDCVVRTDVEAGTFIDVNEVTVNVYIAKERVVINPPEATPAPTPSPAPTPAPGT
ncbi:PASTA domain-containing protein [Candidatus Allofournierella merdavium]|uniref:protein kinase domain-containing protein n=1 Tax=Candidatus Allofournierella merdavium TaxID=2838593 RepID=UPI00374F1D70